MSQPPETVVVKKPHPDERRDFAAVFADCLFSVTRDAGIALTVTQTEKLRKTAQLSGQRMELKMTQKVYELCGHLSEKTGAGFKAVGSDIKKHENIMKALGLEIKKLQSRCHDLERRPGVKQNQSGVSQGKR